MLILTEENQELKNKIFQVPEKIMELISMQLSKCTEKDIDGYDRAVFILNSNGRLTTEVLKRIKNYFDYNKNKENKSYNLIGGDLMKNWVESTLENARSKSNGNKQMKSNSGQSVRKDSIIVPYIRK